MKLVILGQKKQQNGHTIYRTFQNGKYEHEPKMELEPGQTVRTLVSPFPFEVFSSLDFRDEKESFISYEPCYLLIDADVKKHKLNKMVSGDKSSHQFYDCKMTFISEFNKPFEYALEQYYRYKKLDIWDLVTWLPHQKTRSESEFKAMSKIFDIDYKKGFQHSISFDKWIIPYLPQLVDEPNLEFGDGGYFNHDVKTLNAINNLSVDKLNKFVNSYVYDINELLPFWITHPMLGESWFWHQLSDKNSVTSKILIENSYGPYNQLKNFNWKKLLNWRYNTLQSKDSRDLSAFFNSSSIEKKYQIDNEAYQKYFLLHADDDTDEDIFDDDDEYYYDDDEVYPARDKRVDYLNRYLWVFTKVLTMKEFKQQFPMVPDIVWERFEKANFYD